VDVRNDDPKVSQDTQASSTHTNKQKDTHTVSHRPGICPFLSFNGITFSFHGRGTIYIETTTNMNIFEYRISFMTKVKHI
jgi:hypothetical protein